MKPSRYISPPQRKRGGWGGERKEYIISDGIYVQLTKIKGSLEHLLSS